MKNIVLQTSMKEIPNNCVDCNQVWCKLPVRENDETTVKSKYSKKRHESCKLIEVETGGEK